MGNSNWIEDDFFKRYGFCDAIRDVAHNFEGYVSDIAQELAVNNRILGLVRPWQEDTALHKISRLVIESKFEMESEGGSLTELFPGENPPRRALPVDAALNQYGLTPPGTYFAEPSEDLTSTERENAYYSYWQDLRISDPYDRLLTRLSEEAFTVLFSDPVVLESLNQFLAMKLSWYEPEEEMLENSPDPVLSLFSGPGVLKPQPPSAWAREVVFHRDKGQCTICASDLNPWFNDMTAVRFDYIVPLEEGGLNDVTNIQLICSRHNSRNGSRR